MMSHRLRLGLTFLLLASLVAVGACTRSEDSTTSTSTTIPPGSTKVTKSIASGTLTVAPGGSRDIRFYVDILVRRPRVTGSFHASGGANDIDVLILSDDDYESWRMGRTVKPIYDSRATTTGDIDVLLPTFGSFHLVLNNTYANAQKFVEANVYVEWWVAPSGS